MEQIQNDEPVVVALGNVFEFNERHNAGLSTASLVARRRFKESFGVSGDLALFWGGVANRRIVVTPQKPNPRYLRHLQDRLGVSMTVLAPRLRTGWVCRDLLSDATTLSQLVTMIAGRAVRVLAWGATSYYYALLATLRERGVQIVSHDFPTFEERWVVDYCDSKSGARTLLQNMTLADLDVRVPPGFVCHNLEEAGGLAAFLHAYRGVPVVIKSDWGDGGKAVRVLSTDDHGQAFGPVWARFVSEVQGEALWNRAAIIVEEAVGLGHDLTTPSADGYIDADGAVRVLGVQNMLTIRQKCVGFEMGRGLLPHALERRLGAVVERVGRRLSLLGYRGWFDIDFLLPNDDSGLFISEINPRRTGGSSPLEFASRRLGDGWADTYYLRTYERFELPHVVSLAELMDIVTNLNTLYSGMSAEIVPLHVRGISLRQPYVGYVIYAKTRDDALGLEAAFSSRMRRTAETVAAQSRERVSSCALV